MAENEKLEQASKAGSDKADKAKKDKQSKPGIFARASKWLHELKVELKKVQWPTKKQTINNTGIVIACCVLFGDCNGDQFAFASGGKTIYACDFHAVWRHLQTACQLYLDSQNRHQSSPDWYTLLLCGNFDIQFVLYLSIFGIEMERLE